MGDKDKLLIEEDGKGSSEDLRKKGLASKAPWCFGIGFLLFWALLFYAIVMPLFYRLPTALSVDDAETGEFIGDRAYDTLNNLVSLGVRLAGSEVTEADTVAFLLKEIADIQENMLVDYFTLEVDVQNVTSSHVYSNLLEWYHEVKNVVVKLAPKNSTSETYLLINSHFDTVPTSPGASDDGFMVATMLEVIRVMATTKQQFEHPIIFLFNGDEEMGMQASHGFITQQKWAPYCKAFINLEGAGAGSREILFQTGPNHPWLATYYRENAKHPFATTLAEEIFQAGLIPSDTDYRIIVQYGNIPGLDIAQVVNGYVYHTKYDSMDVIPRGSIQNTGENILSLARALSNASELSNIEANESGHVVFFDFLGLFMISYTEDTGKIINYSTAGAAILLVIISIWRMSAVASIPHCQVVQRIIILVILQIIALVLSLGLPLVVAYYFDSIGLSIAYFSSLKLIIGLYICPSLLGLSLPVLIYFHFNQKNKLPFYYHLQLALHSWAIILGLLDIGVTLYGIRSTYLITIPLAFYTVSLGINLLLTFHDSEYSWTGLVTTFQIVPFLYSSYLIYTFIVAMTPMNGRSGSASNPDTMIAGLAALGTILSFGFLIPLTNAIRRPFTVALTLVLISGVCMYLTISTDIGFPYRAKTHTERVMYQHVRRIFYEYDGTVSKDESGYLFNFQDRREYTPYAGVNLTGNWRTKTDCEDHMMCGLPLYDERWVENRLQGMWVPRATVTPPTPTTLELVNKTLLANSTTVRYTFNLTGPHHMSLFLQAFKEDFVTISNWSFSQAYLQSPPTSPLAYHIYMTFGSGNATAQQNFYVDISTPNGDVDVPLFEIGVSGHYILDKGDALSQKFAASFPSYAALVQWPSVYYRYIF